MCGALTTALGSRHLYGHEADSPREVKEVV